jgi:hypothetical protein
MRDKSFTLSAFFLHNIANTAAVIIAIPKAAPSPAAIGILWCVVPQLFDAEVEEVLVKRQLVMDARPVIVLVIVLMFVTVAGGNIAVPAATKTVPLPDVQQVRAASSWPSRHSSGLEFQRLAIYCQADVRKISIKGRTDC